MMKKNCLTILLFLLMANASAQDPHFSQFFMAPQFVNPAIIGNFTGADWRMMTNLRTQWGNAGTPYNTETISGEYKIMGTENIDRTLTVGTAMMLDQSMYGAFKSNYLMASMSYQQPLNANSKLSAGVQTMYGNRRIDYSRLTFGEQFTSGGFDVTLPTGESALGSIKPIFSLSAGLQYTYSTDYFSLDFGGAIFHLNKPKQTFFDDPKQILPMRYLLHSNIEYQFSNQCVLNINACYQEQALPNYFSVGGAVGWDVSNGDWSSIFFAGGWFREGDSFYPFAGYLFNNIQFGLSYDITHSKQNKGPYVPQSAELSIVIKNTKSKHKGVPCPISIWK